MARKQILSFLAIFKNDSGFNDNYETSEVIYTKQISKAVAHVQKYIDGELKLANWYEDFSKVACIELYAQVKGDNEIPYQAELRKVFKVK